MRHFRIDESCGFAWVLQDPPQFTRSDELPQVDLRAERFGSLHPENVQEIFEDSELVFAAADGTWSALKPWST
ncbi:hypothetical protein [Streptomyces melanogenes]|uniref:hypothetical protein n=1 Tax=Streptomyces melanogenes TaxID=67326 RepID=UPI00167D82BC|nr:hypothetical protein [Streptomyces melanogenes]